MGVRGKTSGDQLNRKVKNPAAAISEDVFVDYHFKDGAKRKSVADNPRKSIARQILGESAMEVFKKDLQEEGPLYKVFEDRMELLELVLGEDFASTVLKDLILM